MKILLFILANGFIIFLFSAARGSSKCDNFSMIVRVVYIFHVFDNSKGFVVAPYYDLRKKRFIPRLNQKLKLACPVICFSIPQVVKILLKYCPCCICLSYVVWDCFETMLRYSFLLSYLVLTYPIYKQSRSCTKSPSVALQTHEQCKSPRERTLESLLARLSCPLADHSFGVDHCSGVASIDVLDSSFRLHI